MDEFEKHIRKSRDGMDIHDPDPAIWNRIQRDLPRSETRSLTYLWRAAAIILIAGAGIALVLKTTRTSEQLNDPKVRAVQETYLYYNSQIKSLYDEAQPLLTANPDVRKELEQGMNQLDSLSVQIRKDLGDNIASEEVIEALIHNYRLRIELMEDMLVIMRKTEAEKGNNVNHEL